jgi:two-component system KDP operon response regulator KdpE
MNGKKILIVDDDKEMLLGLTVRLRANGYDVTSASDGIAAIAATRKDKPDLMILDLGLPAGDGFQVLEWLHRNPDWVSIPVVVLTAQVPMRNKVRSFLSGAEAFLQKPVENQELMLTISEVLRNRDRVQTLAKHGNT